METLHIGPVGGNGGKPFDNYAIPEKARVTAVHVYTEWVINAIQLDYMDSNGENGGRPPIGGLGGEHHVFYLDEDEYLTGISGRAGWYVDSIRFHTNKRLSPSYGGTGGDREYNFEAPAGHEVTGFFGRSAWYIDALGILVRRQIDPVVDDQADNEEGVDSWLELAGEATPLPASVIVRRQVIDSNESLVSLEDAALAEAIAGLTGNEVEEGTVDATIYTQVFEEQSGGQSIAVVMAVASETVGNEPTEDESQEVAVMVTDVIESDDDMAALEEEAVEGVIDLLLEDMEDESDEVDVTIYSGVQEDADGGESYAAVVAIAKRVTASNDMPTRSTAGHEIESRQPRPAELELVEGIGPKIAELLIANGIYDLADLAETSVETVRKILSDAGRRFRLADPGTWQEQAALGAAGKWDELSELQVRLKAGR